MINKQLYTPEFVKIKSIKDESDLVKSYKLDMNEGFKPGQFAQLSVLGAGEVPISISSSALDKNYWELTVRNVGKVTGAIHNLKINDLLGLRGPYGNSFPIEEYSGKDLIFVAGGIGLAALRSLILYALEKRQLYARIYLLYGARTQDEIIFKDELKKWKSKDGFDVLLTVDKAEKRWQGNVGVVTALFDKVNINPRNCVAFVCGPSIMMRYTFYELLRINLGEENIFATLERYMKCGVGKCGHCYINDKYVCSDGAVFSLRQLKAMQFETMTA